MPRPKGSVNMPDGYNLLVRFTGEQKDYLKSCSELYGYSHAEIVRLALDMWMDRDNGQVG